MPRAYNYNGFIKYLPPFVDMDWWPAGWMDFAKTRNWFQHIQLKPVWNCAHAIHYYRWINYWFAHRTTHHHGMNGKYVRRTAGCVNRCWCIVEWWCIIVVASGPGQYGTCAFCIDFNVCYPLSIFAQTLPWPSQTYIFKNSIVPNVGKIFSRDSHNIDIWTNQARSQSSKGFRIFLLWNQFMCYKF